MFEGFFDGVSDDTNNILSLSDAHWIGGIGGMHMVQSFVHNIIERRKTPSLQNNLPPPPRWVPRMLVGTFQRITSILHTISPPPTQPSPCTISCADKPPLHLLYPHHDHSKSNYAHYCNELHVIHWRYLSTWWSFPQRATSSKRNTIAV